MPLDPLEALDRVIDGSRTLLHNSDRFGPGGIVGRQQPEVREALQQLTSKMTQGQRVDPMQACGPHWDPDPNMREYWIQEHNRRIRQYGWLKSK